MALSFPLTAAQFMALIKVQSARFWLPDAVISEATEGGEIFSAARGPRLWQAEFSLVSGTHADADRDLARLALLAMPGASFFAYDPRRSGPYNDAIGTLLGSSAPIISNVGYRDIGISGLPAGYVLKRGDYIGWSYGASPTRYALHRMASDQTASGAGTIAAIEVIPPVRPGLTVGTAVSLRRPVCKMVLVPGSLSAGEGRGVISGGASFRASQTLR
jgi:hypothetical protein